MKDTHRHSTQVSLHDFIGLPYSAFDCWELVKYFYIKIFNQDLSLGITYEDSNNHQEVSRLVEIQKNNFTKIDTPMFGDIILLRVFGLPAHVGIYIDNSSILHTAIGTGSVLDKASNWDKRILGYYRYED